MSNEPVELHNYLKLRPDAGGSPVPVGDIYNSYGVIVTFFVRNLFVVAGLLIFFLLIGAGLSFLKDTEKGKNDAKSLATGAVIGFIIMFSAFWIMQIIQHLTGAVDSVILIKEWKTIKIIS